MAAPSDNHWLVIANYDGTAGLWDLTRSDPSAQSIVLAGHERAITAVSISPDNHWLVTASDDHTARLWNLTKEDPSTESLVLAGHQDFTGFAVRKTLNQRLFCPESRIPSSAKVAGFDTSDILTATETVRGRKTNWYPKGHYNV